MDLTQNDIAANSSCWDVHAAKIEAEPVITVFTIIVYADTVTVDSHTSTFIKIIFQYPYIRQSPTNFSVPVINVEHSSDRTNTFGCPFICYDFLCHPVVTCFL